jgi:hypothetical protein
MVARLQIIGILATARRPGYSYVQLNETAPIYAELRELLTALSPAAAVHSKPAKGHLHWQTPSSYHLDELFSSKVRSRVLCLIASAERTNLTTISKTLGLGLPQTARTLAHWEGLGILKSTRLLGRRILQLDPTFLAAVPLKRLLDKIVSLKPSLQQLRDDAST